MATAASAAVTHATAVPSTPKRRRSGAWARWVWSVPDLLPVAVAGFSVPAIVMLLANNFIPAIALALGVVGASVAVGLVRAGAVEIVRRDVVLAGVGMGIVGIWVLLNLRFSAENLFAQRDSATYELTARWLVDHQSLPIHTQPDLFGSPPGFDGTSAGFQRQTDTTVFAQGNHLLPVLLAIVGSDLRHDRDAEGQRCARRDRAAGVLRDRPARCRRWNSRLSGWWPSRCRCR
jgi:hypothetical protein